MGKTTNFEIPYPELNDTSNIPEDMKKMAEAIDTQLGNLIPVACAIRPTAEGWILIDDEDHKPINVTGISINSDGLLQIEHTPEATKVGALTVTTDETFLKYGISGGTSVGLDNSKIRLRRKASLVGYFTRQADGSYKVDNDFSNLAVSCEWDSSNNCLFVTLDENTKLAYPKSFNARTQYNVSPPIPPYMTRVSMRAENTFRIYSYDSSFEIVSDPAKLDVVHLMVEADEEIDPNKLVEYPITNANLWINGYMIKE